MTVRLAQTLFWNWAPTRILGLAGQDQSRRIRGRGLEHLAGKQHDGGFDDGHQNRKKRQQHHRKIDSRGTGFIAAKSIPAGEAGQAPGHQLFEVRHGRRISIA